MIKTIYCKEMMELARDKKTLMFMIILPLLIFPALFGTVAFFASKTVQQEQTRSLTYAIANQDQAPVFVQLMKEQAGFKAYQAEIQNDSQSWERLVRQGKVDFVLAISAAHTEQLANHEQSQWQLHFNNAELTNSVWPRVNKVIEHYNRTLTEQKLLQLKVKKSAQLGLIQPVSLTQMDIAQKKESLGTKLGGMVAYILLPLCLMGAIYPAIDLGAGEKEHGTLESLIISPASPVAIVMAKFLTIVTTSFTAAFMAVFSLLFWGFVFAQALAVEAILNIVSTLGAVDMLLALFMLVPIVLFFSALVLAISIYARSFKEAQNYMGPLTIIVIGPLVIAMLPGINLDWQWAMVPVTNVALAVKDILKGAFDWGLISFVWFSQVVIAAIMLAFTVFWFKREAVLFR